MSRKLIELLNEQVEEEGGRSGLSDMDQLPVGDLFLDVQASITDKSEPEDTLDDFSEYSAVQVMMWSKDVGVNKTVREVAPGFPRLKEIEECEEDNFGAILYAYVDLDVACDLYDYLAK